MNPIHYKAPPNSPAPTRVQRNTRPYEDNADESISEEIYADITDREEGQGNSKPVPIPARKAPLEKVTNVWADIYFGD